MTEQTARHREIAAHEREQEDTRKDENVTEEIFDTVTTIKGGDTTTTMRHGVRNVRSASTGEKIREYESEMKEEAADTLMAKEEKGRVRDCREEDAGLARYVLGAMIALLLILTITKTKTYEQD